MEIEELFQKLKPKLGRQIDDLWLIYCSDPKSKQEIEGLLHLLASQYLDETYEKKGILLEPIPEEMAKGDYFMGTVMYGQEQRYPFCLKENELIQHFGCYGRSGSGKTNLILLLLKGFLQRHKPFLIFDWKRNYRDILIWPSETKDVLVFTVGRDVAPFRFNPLIPPKGTPIDIWIKRLVDVLAHAFYLGEGVAYLLQKALDECYKNKFREGNTITCPTFADVRNWLANYKARGREAQWYDSTRRAIESLCFGSTGDVFNIESNSKLEELLNRQVVLELDTLSSSEKTFLIESVLLWIHGYRIQEAQRETFKHAIIIEEAHHILLRNKSSKENMTDVILREVREFGEAIILIDQHPGLISIPALGNTFCTVAMNLKHSTDTSALANAMLLDDTGREYLGRLPVGYGIVRLQNWRKPFLVRFPLVRISKGAITDEILKTKMAGYFEENKDILPIQEKRKDILTILPTDKIEKTILTETEKKMLLDVMQNPFDGVAVRYKRLSFSAFFGNKIKAKLITNGLLKPVKVPVKKGSLLFELTEKAIETLRSIGCEVAYAKGKEGIIHRYWKHKAGEHLKAQGYDVTYEHPIGEGKTVDLVVKKGTELIAIEIETGNSEPIRNVKKCINAGFKRIIILTTTVGLKESLEKWWQRETPQNNGVIIQFCWADNFITAPILSTYRPSLTLPSEVAP